MIKNFKNINQFYVIWIENYIIYYTERFDTERLNNIFFHFKQFWAFKFMNIKFNIFNQCIKKNVFFLIFLKFKSKYNKLILKIYTNF